MKKVLLVSMISLIPITGCEVLGSGQSPSDQTLRTYCTSSHVIVKPINTVYQSPTYNPQKELSEQIPWEMDLEVAGGKPEESVGSTKPTEPEQTPTDMSLKEKLPTREQLKNIEPISPVKYHKRGMGSHEMVFMAGSDSKGKYLYGDGVIKETTYTKFENYISKQKKKGVIYDRIMLHSVGGAVSSGFSIGKYIYDNGWSTDVENPLECHSSCGFIYMAGEKKSMTSGSKVGLHRPYNPNVADSPEETARMRELTLPYWKYIGADMALFDKFMKYNRDDMYILNSKDLK
jgi:ATP-dependent protease ClpP protease subunit